MNVASVQEHLTEISQTSGYRRKSLASVECRWYLIVVVGHCMNIAIEASVMSSQDVGS